MTPEPSKHCLNCQHELMGRYCHHCGQRGEVARVTWKSLISEFTSKWFGWDNKFFGTLKGLTIAPGRTVRSYLDGNRVRFIGPVGYLFFTTLIFIFVYDVFNIDLASLLQKSTDLVQQDLTEEELRTQMALRKRIGEFVTNYYRYVLIAAIPFLSLCSLVFYRRTKRKFNFLENTIFYFYVLSHSLWLSILLDGVLIYFGQNPLLITPSLSMIYYVYALYSFQERKGFLGIVSSVLTIVTGYVVFSILAGILVAFYLQSFSGGP